MPLAARAGRRCHVATESRDFKGGVGLKGTSVKGANGIMNPRYPPSGKADQMGDNANSGQIHKAATLERSAGCSDSADGVALLAISIGYWVRHRQYAWWRKTRNEPLNELSAIKSCGRLSDFQAAVIEWLIEFRETCPNVPVPEGPPMASIGSHFPHRSQYNR
jgi:hypothetical protein